MTTTEIAANPVDLLADRLFGEGIGAFHLFTVYLGVRLGLFRALAQTPGLTAEELAARTSIDERYALEWLQAETIAELIIADGMDYASARFTLADGVVETLVDEVGPAYVGGIALAASAVGVATPHLVDAYRSGSGLSFAAYGPDMVDAQAAFNRPAYVNELASAWLPQIPEVLRRLQNSVEPARVADIGCGCGWASIELAKAFPRITVDGFDSDADSIESARRNAKEHGVDERVRFEVVDATSTGYGSGNYDVIFLFECVHDFGRPVEALAAARTAVADTGHVIVMDERTADHPLIGDPVETFFAAVSATWCLPQSRVVPDCEAPGTLMRPAMFEALARRAGWAGVDVLPIDNAFFRFYRLVRESTGGHGSRPNLR
ncbi:MAG: class I SAM-dependent methyltransferase [Mycobacteriales bacterium]